MKPNHRSFLLTWVAMFIAILIDIGCLGSINRTYDDLGGTTNSDGGPRTSADGSPGDGEVSPDGVITPSVIGGTATAVLGSGLVLQNNGKDDLAVASSGAFMFKTPLFPGETYSVTVLTQPSAPSQTCTVASGTGTANGADVMNVKVACVTDSYKVGGTVVGLVGTGLVLQNNGGNDLSVGGSTFSFANPVPSGGNYNVTIKTQPSGQTCSISGGTGTIVAGDVTSVVVNCQADTFTIGGTVTGLAGSVVLQNNGGNDRLLTANGSFAFSTPIPSGSTYSVTVKTQPSSPVSQTCVVGSGSGTAASANVTSVVVTCTTNKFTIGGTVSGLSGTLVLRNNGGNDRTISANGSFSFTTPIASGAAYSVTVLTHPVNQACQVANGSGSVGSKNVTSVAVSCSTLHPLSQNFDGVAPPALPAGWSSTIFLGGSVAPWQTTSASAHTAPNSAFLMNYDKKFDIVLDSPAFTVGSSTAVLSFQNSWDTENRGVGGVLEISIAGGGFQDIIAAGGVFMSAGYNNTTLDSPLAGRQSWTGSGTGAFTNTTVRLPATANGKSVKLRWRLAGGGFFGDVGWRIDSVVVTN